VGAGPVKSRYSHIVTLVAAILAFVPVVGVDWLLDGYIRGREQGYLHQTLQVITERVQAAAYDSISALRAIVGQSPSLCAPTFAGNVRKALSTSPYLRDVQVRNPDGVLYCDAYGANATYTPLTADLSIPGATETIGVGTLGPLTTPVMKLTEPVGTERFVSAFVPLISGTTDALLNRFRKSATVQIALTTGVPLLSLGNPQPDGNGISAVAFAGELPIQVRASVPFSVARDDYSDLHMSFTVIACLMSGAFLVLALQYVRRSKLPALDLERAIRAGEIRPYYQPVINLKTGELAGCEVLCRWEKPNGDVVMPGAFIDYAEMTGLAIPMTVSLMQQVRLDLSDLSKHMPRLKISINLFEGHFRDGSIVEDVRAIFGDSDIGFRQLVFEITERQPLANSRMATSVIAGLHALGCRLAMDDVGTGHSNLAYMQTLGVDIIKIDRIFIDMIKADTQQVPVLDGLIGMSRELGTDIIAEGVETEAQALYLRRHGVIMAQGFLFAPAIKVAPFCELARALAGTSGSKTTSEVSGVAAA
jgi:EAL domain-containing protein (putative c-di-GMP-specific phosphodiesterase class I)